MVKKEAGNRFGIASFVCGLLSLIFFMLFFLPISSLATFSPAFYISMAGIVFTLSFYLAAPLAILGIIFALIQRKKKPTKLANWGLALSIISLCLALFLVITFIRGFE